MFKHTRPIRANRSQRGMALIFALLVLAALMLASVAMVKVVSSGSQIAGNLAFRQDALMSSEHATQMAINTLAGVLAGNLEGLNNDNLALGYYANTPAGLDPSGNALEGNNARILINWDANDCDSFASGSFSACALTPRRNVISINGNSASYIVFRLCNAAGVFTDAEVNCARVASSGDTNGPVLMGTECQGARNYADPGNCDPSGFESPALYRILVRTVGPRNTVSMTETLAYF